MPTRAITEERPRTAGPDNGPEPPFPIRLNGEVIKGFGRGSKELGIPTANIPLSGLNVGGHDDLESGIYFGLASLGFPSPNCTNKQTNSLLTSRAKPAEEKLLGAVGTTEINAGARLLEELRDSELNVYSMVMSIGWNPFYKNTVRSVEVHIMHPFTRDFYGAHLNLLILGFIRPEYDYVSKDLLIQDILTDIDVASRSLKRPAYAAYAEDPYLDCFRAAKAIEESTVEQERIGKATEVKVVEDMTTTKASE